jgi:SpoVK/Ycf46/Vps4 family AAA+-type ATPase
VLFELMNEMSGLGEDADVAFVLTTNRPDALEPALAARPGRVDLAVEIPLPDEVARRALLDLYARGRRRQVTDADLAAALDDLLADRSALTRVLLRAAGPPPPARTRASGAPTSRSSSTSAWTRWLRTGASPSNSGSSESRSSQSAYHDAQSGSSPSVMR